MNKEKKQEDLTPYIELLRPHREHLTSSRKWNDYRLNLGLPHSQTLIRKFGSWNALKETLEIGEVFEPHRPVKYDAAIIREILKEHGKHLTSQVKWNEYAKNNKLPNYTVIFERLSEDQVFELTDYRKTLNKDSVVEMIKKYYPTEPPTSRQWNMLAKEKPNVPSSSSIILMFESWKKMIREVYGPRN